MDMPFFPGRRLSPPEPLAVFLPPYREGLGAEFLRRLGKRSPRIVDPFGQSPALALELARSGAAVLLASPNPVLRAILGLQADPPPTRLIQNVLARIANSPSSAAPDPAPSAPQTLEAHLRSLYRGKCAFCGKESEAAGYVWEYEPEPKSHATVTHPPARGLFQDSKKRKPKPRLSRRICACPDCGHRVEEPAGPADEKAMPSEASRRLLYHFALERLAPLDDPSRAGAADALDAYPSRSLYALVLILRRLESMEFTAEEKRCVDALLLTVLDRAHILRGHGHSTRTRPRSLQPPAEFLEVNIWRALEEAAEVWSAPARPVPFRKWREGDSPEAGSIMTFAGTARELAPHAAALRPDGLITFLPRPNQAAWTLSAVWAEWLWGRAAAAPLAGSLQRRWFDWNWHARALGASAAALAASLPADLPAATFLGECEPGFLTSALWALYQAGFVLKGRAIRTDTGAAQLLWSTPGPEHTPLSYGPLNLEGAEDIARLAVRQLISSRAEPVPWDLMHAAYWSEEVFRRMLPPEPPQADESGFARCVTVLAEAVRTDKELKSTEKKEENEFGTTWWLPGDESITNPLADEVEMETARMLLEDGPLPAEELDRRLCSFFPGLLTPEQRLLQVCLESYGAPTEDGGAWVLRPEDHPASRTKEMELMRAALSGLGIKMGFAPEGNPEMYWIDASGRKAYCFLFIHSGAVGRYLLQPVFEPRLSWIVLPGGRATLVGHKLRRNVLLRRAVSKGWRFMKFRHIRRLLEDPYLRPENLDERMGLDPLEVTEDKVPLL
ncbi:MAG: hypothetical protein JW929_14405 [Anaerolineales bacterium]|nr:hypothetical protein [Anaerolineales bacterium]